MTAAYRRAMASICWSDASTDEFTEHPDGAPWCPDGASRSSLMSCRSHARYCGARSVRCRRAGVPRRSVSVQCPSRAVRCRMRDRACRSCAMSCRSRESASRSRAVHRRPCAVHRRPCTVHCRSRRVQRHVEARASHLSTMICEACTGFADRAPDLPIVHRTMPVAPRNLPVVHRTLVVVSRNLPVVQPFQARCRRIRRSFVVHSPWTGVNSRATRRKSVSLLYDIDCKGQNSGRRCRMCARRAQISASPNVQCDEG